MNALLASRQSVMRLAVHLRWPRFACLIVGLISPLTVTAADLISFPQLGLRVARGFRVSVFADADMANDIYAMTLDPRGNPVVTSQGYIRTLLDEDDDGEADDSEEFATTRTGGMGLCFDGNDLMFVGDGGLWRFTDANGDGRADGPAAKIFSLEFAEHGGHAPRRGPDGLWYLIAGNDTKFSMTSQKVEGGALLRFGSGGGVEVVAEGFRNPYDFDFNDHGDIFTYDSDCERDFFLPWHLSTRLYHVPAGGHHGWRLDGYMRSWARPDYYADTVGTLAFLGRGSPTGVLCYRHTQFPEYYQNGIFALDWTFGKIFFLPHDPQDNGSSYAGVPEVFLEPIGNQGFAPTDAVVAPDGSMFVSIGGRKTRGAVYRIEYVAEPARNIAATNWLLLAGTDVLGVLDAPQPLEEWSRALWLPIAQRVDEDLFAQAATDNGLSAERRSRAIELFTELFGGLPTALAGACARASDPVVRARTAWSLGRIPADGDAPILLALARDASPYVRTYALEALDRRANEFDAAALQNALSFNIAYADRRVHQAAAQLAAALPEPAFRALWTQQEKSGLAQGRLTVALAALWRSGTDAIHTNVINLALTVLNQSRLAEHQLDAVRLVILALGDWKVRNASLEVFTGYEPALRIDPREALAVKIRRAVLPLFPAPDPRVNIEIARLLAMLEADEPVFAERLLTQFTERSTASADFHYLAVLAKLRAPLLTNTLPKIAAAILALDRKLDGLEQRPKQNWSVRLAEVVQSLVAREPRLADAMMRDANFTRPGNVPLAVALGSGRYTACGRIMLGAVRRVSDFPWTVPLIDLLATVPIEETQALFRQQWAKNPALRDRLVIELAHKPEPADRDKFIAGLASADLKTAHACASALLQLPRGTSTRALAPAFRQLRALLDQPKEDALRAKLVELLARDSGQPVKPQESGADLRRAYQPVVEWFTAKYPGLAREADSDDRDDPLKWNSFYKTVAWQAGNVARGEALFSRRGCQVCHVGPQPIGPDLSGVASRLSPTDLFNTIIFPSRDVAPAYRTTAFRTRDGSTYTGMVAFESADGVILQLNATETVRLAEAAIASRAPSTLSLMPSGLLNGITPQEAADLYAFLRSGRAAR